MGEEAINNNEEPQLIALTSGEQLKAARVRQKLTVKDVADRTRISARQIEMIEAGDLAALPGRTYAIGFSRTYAKLVGEDEEAIRQKVHEELAQIEPAYDPGSSHHLEPGDPARVPSRNLAWPLAFAAVILLIGGYAFYRTFIGPAESYPAIDIAEEAAPAEATGADATAAPAATQPTGQVVFTSLEDGIWVKFYDADGRQLMQKQMAQGERYTVPPDAQGPQIWTGRPDALSITIGGQAVPKLSESDRIMRDIPVTAEALLARSPPAAETGTSPTT